MRRQLVDAVDVQTVCIDDPSRGLQREVAEVLVVDRVVLESLDEPQEMWELEGRGAARCEQNRDALDEVVDVRHVGEDVVAGDQVSVAVLCDDLAGECGPEELRQRRHPDLLRSSGDVLRRLDAEDPNARADEMPEEVAVVRCQFNHEARAVEFEALDHQLDVAPGVLHP